jgi:hypothetical protein
MSRWREWRKRWDPADELVAAIAMLLVIWLSMAGIYAIVRNLYEQLP